MANFKSKQWESDNPCKLVLDAHQFYSSEADRTIGGKTVYASNYKYSDIRTWLNGYSSTYGEDWNNKGFLQRAFSESEQEFIQTTLVDNSAFTDSYGSTSKYACENTNDKVWLLSYQDLTNTGYGFNSDRVNYDPMRSKKTSDYSRANYAYYYTSEDYMYDGVWWSRSPYSLGYNYAWRASSSGHLMNSYVTAAGWGVTPALTISLKEYVASENNGDYGIYNSGTLNLYGGSVYDHIYSSGTLNTKVGANIQGQITLSDTATIVVEDYAGITPNYKINLASTHNAGTIITFKGSSTQPDISKLTVTGYDIEKNELKTEKDSEGNWVVVLKMIPQYIRVEENGYSYVYFGSYPQTIKASNVTVDESKYKTNQAGEKYYLGSDGEYYAKFTANPYYSDQAFSDGTTIVSGTSYYFKVEPIKWRILSEDNGQAIILAELILDAHQFYSSESDRTIDGKTIYANNYKYSDIRSWLNGYSSTYGEDWNNKGFLQRAFSESEQEYIQTTLVDNSAVTDAYGSTANYACENTNDKVWLLSYQDMINTSYGFNSDIYNYDTMRIKKTSDYSRANYAYYSTSSDYLYNGLWWSRSPSSSNDLGAWVSDYGGFVSYSRVYYASRGVVPALTISLNGKAGDTPVSWSFASGAGENNASADTLHKSDTLATNSKANSIFNFNTFATIKEYNNTLFGFNAFTNANYYLNTLHNFNDFVNSKNYIKSLYRYGFANNKNRNIIYDFENKDGKTCFLTQTGKSLPSSCRYCMSEGGLKNFNTPQYIVNTITNIDLLSDKRKNYALLFGNKRYKAFYEPKVYGIA